MLLLGAFWCRDSAVCYCRERSRIRTERTLWLKLIKTQFDQSVPHRSSTSLFPFPVQCYQWQHGNKSMCFKSFLKRIPVQKRRCSACNKLWLRQRTRSALEQNSKRKRGPTLLDARLFLQHLHFYRLMYFNWSPDNSHKKNYYSGMELLIWRMQCEWSPSYQWDRISGGKKSIGGMRRCFVNR